jgi:hypothetical protein
MKKKIFASLVIVMVLSMATPAIILAQSRGNQTGNADYRNGQLTDRETQRQRDEEKRKQEEERRRKEAAERERAEAERRRAQERAKEEEERRKAQEAAAAAQAERDRSFIITTPEGTATITMPKDW